MQKALLMLHILDVSEGLNFLLDSVQLNVEQTVQAPSEPSQPPGGRHEGVPSKMRVPTLGSRRRPVASAPAPGAVGAWTRFL